MPRTGRISLCLSARPQHSRHLNGAAAIQDESFRSRSCRIQMLTELLAFVDSLGHPFLKVLPMSIALGIVFAVLTFIWACNPGQGWWRKRELVTDLCYWFFI